MRKILSTAILLTVASAPGVTLSEEANDCFEVIGTLVLWSGHPPGLRLEAADGTIYGVSDSADDHIPGNLRIQLESGKTRVSGNFVLCHLHRTTTVPYDERPIRMVVVTKYLPAGES